MLDDDRVKLARGGPDRRSSCSRLVGILTLLNLLLLAANGVAAWFLFSWYGARPDGVEPSYRLWLGALWLLGPPLSICSLTVAVIGRGSARHRWVNAAVCAAYVCLWAVVHGM